MSSVFITGAGTEIGKTFLARALIDQLRRRGAGVRAMKPVITGFDPAKAAESDAGLLLRALGLPLDQSQLDRMSPWRFRAPLSPDIAAARENRRISFAELLDFSSANDGAEITLIEGIGGVMVPIDERHTVADWIGRLRVEAILVAGSYLGAISHALTAFETLRTRRIPVRGIVVSESTEPAVAAGETAQVLQRFCADTRVQVLPRVRAPSEAPDLSALIR